MGWQLNALDHAQGLVHAPHAFSLCNTSSRQGTFAICCARCKATLPCHLWLADARG